MLSEKDKKRSASTFGAPNSMLAEPIEIGGGFEYPARDNDTAERQVRLESCQRIEPICSCPSKHGAVLGQLAQKVARHPVSRRSDLLGEPALRFDGSLNPSVVEQQ